MAMMMMLVNRRVVVGMLVQLGEYVTYIIV